MTYDWAIANRGETYFEIGKYTEALADFKHAIDVDDKNAYVFAGRGRTYRRLCVIPALPTPIAPLSWMTHNDRAIANRGETHFEMQGTPKPWPISNTPSMWTTRTRMSLPAAEGPIVDLANIPKL